MGHAHTGGKHTHCGHEGEDSTGALSDRDKIVKMVEHWIHHNGEHERSYRDWAVRAKKIGLDEVDLLLQKAAEDVGLQNRSLQRVLDLLKGEPTPR